MSKRSEKAPPIPLAGVSALQVSALCAQLIKVCGPARILLVDVPDIGILTGLLARGIDAHAASADPQWIEASARMAPGRIAKFKKGTLPFADREFASVALFMREGSRDAATALAAEALRTAAGTVALVVLGDAGLQADRVAIEARMIALGARKHPGQYAVAPYNSLDEPSGEAWFLFERPPAELLARFPLDALKEERDLHMDMTREAGRRSDAHIARYVEAAAFVREGDRVLDAACGLGYGSHLIARTTRASQVTGLDESAYAVEYAGVAFAGKGTEVAFRRGDAQDLSFLADASIDLLVSVETLEHLHHPDVFLAEAVRVLAPGGRLYVSVPNDWSDETGDDPNPHHHHVYDWPKLSSQLTEAGFLMERAWTQDAGGGMRLNEARRAFREFDPASGPAEDGEWILALAMKPPGGSAARSAVSVDEDRPNIIAFGRDYLDPTLVRAMVAMGWRATSTHLLERIARETSASAAPGSADAGAALCVLAYRALAEGQPAESKRALQRSALAYCELEPANPTVFRWQVSLAYVAGLLALSSGDQVEARLALGLAARADALRFSPLLGTKTVAARVLLGRMDLASGNPAGAARHWRRALVAARRLLRRGQWREIIGCLATPQTFGLPELALVVTEAARAANGLRLLAEAPAKVGMVWEATHATLPDELRARDLELALLRDSIVGLQSSNEWIAASGQLRERWMGELHASKNWLDRQFHSLNDECTRLRSTVAAMAAERAEWEESRRWMLDQIDAWKREAESTGSILAEQVASSRSVDEGRAWLESQLASWQEQARLLEARLDETLAETEVGRRWSEKQLASWQAEVALREQVIEALRAAAVAKDEAIAALETGRNWSEEQLASWQAEVASREEAIEALRAAAAAKDEAIATLEAGRNWSEEQLASWRAEVASRDQVIEALRTAITGNEAAIADLETGRRWLEGQLTSWQVEVQSRERAMDELRGTLATQSATITELEAARGWLQEQWKSWEAEAESRALSIEKLGQAEAGLRASVDVMQQQSREHLARISSQEAALRAASDEQTKLTERLAQADRQNAEVSQRVLDLKQEAAQLAQSVAHGLARESELEARLADAATALAGLESRMAADELDRQALTSSLGRATQSLAGLETSRWVRTGRWLRLLKKD